MTPITNGAELRDAYEHLYFLGMIPIRPENAARVEAHRVAVKRAIRTYNSRKSDRRTVRGDYDGIVILINVPEYVTTMEEAEEWFDAEERITYRDRGYDCTGQAFTSGHHIGKLGGKLVCWHRIGIDV